jgi:hypothetical protein
MRRTLLLAAGAAAVLLSRPATAQNGNNASHRAVIASQLDATTRAKGAEGYGVERVVDAQTVVGMLPDRGSVVLELNLRSGVEYFIPAGCDADCDDLDLRVHAPGGEGMLDEDVEADDVPIISFTAPRSGPHLLTVTMSRCKTELCYFGFRVLGKP